jgi:uncharacterized iron-regulated membrane protein
MSAAPDAEVAAPAQAEGRSVVRRVLFWTHLSAGAVAGLVIGLLSLTGAALALERPMLAWLTPRSTDAAAPWLPVDELLSRARAARPGVAPTAVTLNAETGPAWVALGRSGGLGLDGHTGALQGGSAPSVREAFRKIEELHRWLMLSGDARETGEGIVGACTLLFLFLALTGPFLWIPKRWSTVAIRRVSWFRRGLRGRARDWSWHHVLGIWCFPVLIVLSASGVVMSYRWANDAVFRLAGSPPPPPGRPQGPKVEPPGDGAAALPLQRIAGLAMERVPTWRELTVRLDPQDGRKPGPVQLTVRERDARPRFAAVQLWADPFTGKFLREERYGHLSPGRKARVWMRFLHTGEAFGGAGQLVAGLSSLGAAVLVWTGLALALRRLARSLRARPAIGSEAEPSSS